jgi:hypothetical protein
MASCVHVESNKDHLIKLGAVAILGDMKLSDDPKIQRQSTRALSNLTG